MKKLMALVLTVSLLLCAALATAEEVSADTKLYYNPDGGAYYHADASCTAVAWKYRPLSGSFTYGELDDEAYAALMPCATCSAPARGLLESTAAEEETAQEEVYDVANALETYDVAVNAAEDILRTTGLVDEAELAGIREADATLFYNKDGGKSYHKDMNCGSVAEKYLPLTGTLVYSELTDKKYASLTPCATCDAPARPGDSTILMTCSFTDQTEDDAAQWTVTYTRGGSALCTVVLNAENGYMVSMSMASGETAE